LFAQKKDITQTKEAIGLKTATPQDKLLTLNRLLSEL
jgi:hypothetical protein